MAEAHKEEANIAKTKKEKRKEKFQ